MPSIIEPVTKKVHESVARKCDVCGYEERSERKEIMYDHDIDYKWSKIIINLDDYTNANHGRAYYADTFDCSLKLIEKLSRNVKVSNAPKQYGSADGLKINLPAKYVKEFLA